MLIDVFECGPVATNAYLVHNEGSQTGLIIDAPMDSVEVIGDAADRKGIIPKALILTHTHWDHTADAAGMKRRWPELLIYVHPSDEYRLIEPMKHTVWALPFTLEQVQADLHLRDGDRFDLDGISLDVLFTPGHTEGGISLLDPVNNILFVGDTLFAGSVGRTDLPGGDWETLLDSIRRRLLSLPDQTMVYPGHGPKTTIAEERISNPFLG